MPRPKRSDRPAGIHQIADTLGISIGTVDRALHGRPGISPYTRARVLETAKALSYRPNLAARALSSKRQLRLAISLPREIASFWDLVRDGFLQAARLFEANGVEVLEHSFPGLGRGEKRALEAALEDEVHGVVLAPGSPDELAPLLGRAARRGIPVVCVNTDAPGAERLTAISADPTIGGRVVGELMGRFLRGEGRVAVVTGQMATTDHATKLEGFRAAVRELWPALEIASVVEAHDDEAEAYEKCRSVLRAGPDIAGIYVSTANSIPVLRAVEDGGLTGRITVVTTDLFPALADFIESGRVAATLDQRPWTQGQVAFHALYRYLSERIAPPTVIRLAPHVVMRSNLDLFLDRLYTASEGGVAVAAL